eukprot:3962390-Amphidinium_carterae.1
MPSMQANVGSPDAEKRTRITTPQQPVSQATSEAVIVEARRGREKMLCEFKALDGSGSTHHEGVAVSEGTRLSHWHRGSVDC